MANGIRGNTMCIFNYMLFQTSSFLLCQNRKLFSDALSRSEKSSFIGSLLLMRFLVENMFSFLFISRLQNYKYIFRELCFSAISFLGILVILSRSPAVISSLRLFE